MASTARDLNDLFISISLDCDLYFLECLLVAPLQISTSCHLVITKKQIIIGLHCFVLCKNTVETDTTSSRKLLVCTLSKV